MFYLISLIYLLKSIFVFSVASLDNPIWQIGVESRYQVMERCVVPTHSSERSRQWQCFGMYSFKLILCMYVFWVQRPGQFFRNLVQLNKIFNREYLSQARSLVKFIAHLHGAKASLSTTQKIFWHKFLYILCIILYIYYMFYVLFYILCVILGIILCISFIFYVLFYLSCKIMFFFVYKLHGQNLQYSSLVYRQNLAPIILPIAICQTSEWWFGVINAKFIIAIVFV